MTDRILQALGARDELEALRIIEEANEFTTNLKAATGREGFSGMLEIVRNAVGFQREIGNVTERTDKPQECLGVVLAWKSSHDALPAAQSEVQRLTEQHNVPEVARLCKEGLAPAGTGEHGGKLTPALAEYWTGRKDPVELEAFLKVAPRAIPAAARPPAKEPKSPDNSAVPAIADGRKYEELKPAERASLKKEDAPLYELMHSDWLARGKPAFVAAPAKSA
jgi:hypothetical protein